MTDLAHRREANRSAMPNLDELEALVGPLPKGREWERWCEYTIPLPKGREWERWCEYTIPLSLPERGKADAALAEAYAVIERQARMLREFARLYVSQSKPLSWETGEPHTEDDVLADLAARYEEEHHD